MNIKIFNFFEIAGRIASKKDDRRSFLLGSVGIRSDGKMVSAINSPTELPNRMAHSEFRLSKKLDYGATVYVVRVKLCDGKFGLAKPCESCFRALKSKKVNKIYYTISHNEYGVIDL
jgi:tRNA(Arg) A34 adenosine deaminase TadA